MYIRICVRYIIDLHICSCTYLTSCSISGELITYANCFADCVMLCNDDFISTTQETEQTGVYNDG